MKNATAVPLGQKRKERMEILWHVNDGIPIIIHVKNDHPHRGVDFLKLVTFEERCNIIAYYKPPTSFWNVRSKRAVKTFETEKYRDKEESLGDKVLEYLSDWELESYHRRQ